MMRHWLDFLDSLDSNGGKVLVLLVLMLFGVVGAHYKLPKMEDVITGSFGALLMTMKDSGSNRGRAEKYKEPIKTEGEAK